MKASLLAFGLFLLVPGFATARLTVAFVGGTVEYRTAETAWTSLEEGQTVSDSGYVRTGSLSAVELVNESKVRLLFSANTLARIRLDQAPSRDRVLLQAGKVLTEVFATGAEFQVRTATAALGVRGTRFSVLADPRSGSQVAVSQGRVFALGRTSAGQLAEGLLLQAGQKALTSSAGVTTSAAVGPDDAAYFDFSAFDGLAAGRVPTLFDHYAAQQDAFFREFSERDLSDYQLFVLDDLDQQWEFLLAQNQAFTYQLRNAPLKEKP